MVPKEGHVGRFPANFCVKLVGTNADTGDLAIFLDYITYEYMIDNIIMIL